MKGNQSIYEAAETVREYASFDRIRPSEAALLERIKARFSGQRLLDLGVGGGRTTAFLLEISRDYVGLDYSAGMVQSCQRRFPGVRFVHGDARQMPEFGAEEFDFVFFSWNGIDNVSHEDRLQILSEVQRVLRPGGWFVFASHNAANPVTKIYHLSNVEWSLNPLRTWRSLRKHWSNVKRYLANRHWQKREGEYLLLIDPAHDYGLVHYYITMASQQRQLEMAGFRVLDRLDKDGKSVGVDADVRSSTSICYVAEKQ